MSSLNIRIILYQQITEFLFKVKAFEAFAYRKPDKQTLHGFYLKKNYFG